MAGKISDAEENLKVGNILNSNMVKISSTKSILSYQNGSASSECTGDEGMPADGFPEETSMSGDPFPENHHLKSECLDILRKKLISDLSLTVFSTDLEKKLNKMEPIEINKERQSIIQKLVLQISQLSDAEKLLLYLKLPSSTSSSFDPLRQPLNPLGNRQEIQQTIVWIKTHLEEDSEISIPKQDVYDQYLKYCENVSMKPLSTADFGKVMKQVYPGVRPRRLGTRGNSRYCYSGMRNTCKLPTPILPQSNIENSVSNGSGSDGSNPLPAESKFKKTEKSKRKWKSATCRNDKCGTSTRSFSVTEKDGLSHLKIGKRLKMNEGNVNGDVSEEKRPEEVIKVKEVGLGGIKCEEGSDNSYNAFDMEANDFGVYFKNAEKIDESSSRLGVIGSPPSGSETEKKINENKKISFGSELQRKLVQTNLENSFASISGDQTEKSNIFGNHIINRINDQNGNGNSVFGQPKTAKGRTRKSTTTKTPKCYKKSYVPIQPKPIETPKLSVLFEQPINHLMSEKKEPEGLTLCEESDSQEPEEEIVRYFKHLDEKEMNAGGFINQAVKNIESSSSVQISHMSQMVSKTPANHQENEEMLNQTQQILRSQSCLEVPRGLFNFGESNDSIYVPRSQSSVELPMLAEHSGLEALDSDIVPDGKKKKISHLRILLEKSMTSTKNTYSLKDSWSSCNPMMSNAQMNYLVNLKDTNNIFSNSKEVERDMLKTNGIFNSLKLVSKGPSFVPQSPNTRTKYFSFTPISPGPQSPLRTPSTPNASPFVSPRNTPVPRSKLSSQNDFFLSPSERKSAPLRSDGVQENVFNFSRTVVGSSRVDGSRPSSYLQACRPRSFSSTNFCRSKGRRNSSKTTFDREINSAPKNRIPDAAQNFPINSQYPIHRNFMSSDSISTDVQKFLENSKIPEGQSAMLRSQSVPLNRMISESTWMPAQASPVFSSFYNASNSNPTLASAPNKYPDWVNSDANSPKEMNPNMSPFISNGDITNLPSDSFNNEIFSGDPTVQLNGQYYPGEFPPGNEENFPENEPFREEPSFSNKLDLNSSGTFDSAFVSDSDPGMADSIKSYLPDFEGLENKDFGNSNDGADKKFFKNVLYEGGNDNLKDPVITSFKPVLMNEMSSSPGSPVLNFFGTKMNEENQQLIELFDFEN